jgi:uncharacterized membrane protein YwaF
MPAWVGGSYKDYVFKMFSTSHFVIIALLLLVSIGIYLYKDNFKNEKLRKAEIGVAISLIIMEGTYHLWMIVNGIWNISHAIPLELCSISLILR